MLGVPKMNGIKKSITIVLTKDQREKLQKIFKEYSGVSKKVIYQGILEHGIAEIYKKNKWDIKKKK